MDHNNIENNTLCIKTNACIRRRLDCKKFEMFFEKNGYKLIDDEKKADIILFHTCAFNKIRKDECFDLIEKYQNNGGELIITGCLPGIAPKDLDKVFIGKTLVTKELDHFGELFPESKVKYEDIPDAYCPYQLDLTFDIPSIIKKNIFSFNRSSKNYARRLIRMAKLWIKVRKRMREVENSGYLRMSHGCLYRCGYCAIHYATGRLRSKPIEECVTEYEKLLDKGYKTIELCAESTGPYGLDINTNLPELLNRLHEVDKKKGVFIKWRLECIDPKWTTKYMDELLKYVKDHKKMDFIKTDIQSGNNRILKLMNRPYTTEDLQNLKKFREANPNIHLRSQFIAGYPSETEEEFQDTIDLILDLRFDTIQVFAYSDMDGTVSIKMDDKIPQDVIEKRLKKLQTILEKEGYLTFFSFTCLEAISLNAA